MGREKISGVRTARGSGPVLFLSWSAAPGRLRDMAAATGGVVRHIYHPRLVRRWLVPLRYLLSLLETAQAVWALRPRVVVVTNPPIFPALVAWTYCRLVGARLVLDSHTGSFGTMGNRWMSPRPVHRWLVRRTACTLVGTKHWSSVIREWGGIPLVFHEPPPTSAALPSSPPAEPTRPFIVLFVNVFANDEPVAEVLDAARALPDVHFRMTGDLRKAPHGFTKQVPGNVQLIGFLDQPHYWSELQRANAVLTLTSVDTSVGRAACEATFAGRPLIMSDTTVAREYFPHACRTYNDASSIAEAVARVRDDDGWLAEAQRGAALQGRRVDTQLAELRTVLLSPST